MSRQEQIKAASFHHIQNDLKKRFESLQKETGKKLWNRIRKDNLQQDKAVMVTSKDIDKMAHLEIEDLKKVIELSAEREKSYIRNIRELE